MIFEDCKVGMKVMAPIPQHLMSNHWKPHQKVGGKIKNINKEGTFGIFVYLPDLGGAYWYSPDELEKA